MIDYTANFKVIESVKCIECEETHERTSNSYMTVYGNICVGERGGILGGGDWRSLGVPVNIMCRECFVEFIERELK